MLVGVPQDADGHPSCVEKTFARRHRVGGTLSLEVPQARHVNRGEVYRLARPKRNPEKGFALLVVFLMAAGIALSLYLELPRVAFETQREREQLLIERGEQYARAIELFHRKTKTFPQKMDDLEKYQEMRFLRRRYKDPLTGKDEWRVIHSANGVLTDSLVEKPPGLGEKAEGGKDGSGLVAGNGSNPADPNAPQQPQEKASIVARNDLRERRVPGAGMAQQVDPNSAYQQCMYCDPAQQQQQAQQQPQFSNGFGQQQAFQQAQQQLQQQQQQLQQQQIQPGVMPGVPGQQPFQPGQIPGQVPPGVVNQPGVGTQPPGFVNVGGQRVFQPGGNFSNQQPGSLNQPPVQTQPGQFSGNPSYTNNGYNYGQQLANQPVNPNQPYNPNQQNQFTNQNQFTQGQLNPNQQFGAGGVANSQRSGNFGGVAGGFGGGGTGSSFGNPGQQQPSGLAGQLGLLGPRQPPAGLGGLQTLGSGIAGVASNFKGVGILRYKERSKFQEWEFVYDVRKGGKNAQKGLTGVGGQPQDVNNPNGNPLQSPGAGGFNNNSGGGSFNNPGSGGFGNSGGSSFGQPRR